MSTLKSSAIIPSMTEAKSFQTQRSEFYSRGRLLNAEDAGLENDPYLLSVTSLHMGGKNYVTRSYHGLALAKDSDLPTRTVAELRFENGTLTEIRQLINPMHSGSFFVIGRTDDGFAFKYELNQQFERENSPSDSKRDMSRVWTSYNPAGEINHLQLAFFGNTEDSKMAVIELEKQDIEAFEEKTTLPDTNNYGYQFDIERSEDSMHFTALGEKGFIGEATVPLKLDWEQLIHGLFPHEEGIAIPPFSQSIIPHHPTISRSEFPRDPSGKIIDFDEVWRSKSIAHLIGASIHQESPLDKK